VLKIQELNLKSLFNEHNLNSITEVIPHLLNLKKVSLEDNCISDMFVNDILLKCRNLTHLNISRNKFTTLDGKLLKNLLQSRLEYINFSQNAIGDESFVSLMEGCQNSKCIQTLILNSCCITDAGFEQLHHMDNFKPIKHINFA